MQDKQIAKRYAAAFFELSKEKKLEIQEIFQQIDEISKIYSDNKELQVIIQNPTIKISVKLEILKKIIGKEFDENVNDFITILVNKERFYCINEIVKEYNLFLNKEKNIKKVLVYSKTRLEKPYITRLKKAFKNYLKYDVEVENIEKENIIGGIIVKVGDEIIDGTIDHQLLQMREIFNKE